MPPGRPVSFAAVNFHTPTPPLPTAPSRNCLQAAFGGSSSHPSFATCSQVKDRRSGRWIRQSRFRRRPSTAGHHRRRPQDLDQQGLRLGLPFSERAMRRRCSAVNRQLRPRRSVDTAISAGGPAARQPAFNSRSRLRPCLQSHRSQIDGVVQLIQPAGPDQVGLLARPGMKVLPMQVAHDTFLEVGGKGMTSAGGLRVAMMALPLRSRACRTGSTAKWA